MGKDSAAQGKVQALLTTPQETGKATACVPIPQVNIAVRSIIDDGKPG